MLSDIGYEEGIMCDIWIRSLLSLAHGKQEIYQKILKKEFPKDMIYQKMLLLEDEISDWEMHRATIEQKMQTLLNRGKSLGVIRRLFISRYPYFSQYITEYLEKLDDTCWLEKEVQKYKNKYNIEIVSEKQKLYAALMRKGFWYRQIRDELDWVPQ